MEWNTGNNFNIKKFYPLLKSVPYWVSGCKHDHKGGLYSGKFVVEETTVCTNIKETIEILKYQIIYWKSQPLLCGDMSLRLVEH